MSTNYGFTRIKLPDGRWAINNPFVVDGEGNMIRLATEIQQAFPTHPKFTMSINGADGLLIFEDDLTAQELTDLGNIIDTYQNTTGV